MSSIVLSGDTSGSVTVSVPAVSGSNTVTIPAVTGTVMVSSNMPAFSAYSNASQNISNSTWTKVAINTEEFDTANAFDSTTNYRFTPQVAGYYQINGTISFGATTTFPTTTRTGIYKNGSLYRVSQISVTVGQINPQLLNSALLFLNGSTDYVELYGFVSGATGPQMDGGQTITSFNGSLVRAS